MASLVVSAVERCRLNLSGRVVLTEAASGAYVVTPVLAALAGAVQVFALCRSTQYGSVEEITQHTYAVANLLGVRSQVRVVAEKSPELVGQADIVTNSGHVRPIDEHMVNWMKPGAVVPLMYESWEFRQEDVDLAACARRGIAVAGTNERHPAIDVFSYLGVMAVKQLFEAGISVYSSRVLLLCDNPFSGFIEHGLSRSGADVTIEPSLQHADLTRVYDAVLVALQPKGSDIFTADDAEVVAQRQAGAVVVQYWGDIDRSALRQLGVPVWPPEAPKRGHMAILPSAVGPEPIVRLQCGGLKVGEVLARGSLSHDPDREFAQVLNAARLLG
jgi:hypothetical protein